MIDDLHQEDLERYLTTAPVLDIAHFAEHGAHRSYRLILEGGVGVLVKPEHGIGDGAIAVRKEVAAWVVVRELGWPDLVATTVLRRIAFPGEGEYDSSLQVLWPDFQPSLDPNAFPDNDVWRAAVFDAIVHQTDRSGHNWMGVPGSGGAPRLKLFDHGYAFGPEIAEPSSAFYNMKREDPLPSEIVEVFARLEQPRQRKLLEELLDAPTSRAMLERMQQLREKGVLAI